MTHRCRAGPKEPHGTGGKGKKKAHTRNATFSFQIQLAVTLPPITSREGVPRPYSCDTSISSLLSFLWASMQRKRGRSAKPLQSTTTTEKKLVRCFVSLLFSPFSSSSPSRQLLSVPCTCLCLPVLLSHVSVVANHNNGAGKQIKEEDTKRETEGRRSDI